MARKHPLAKLFDGIVEDGKCIEWTKAKNGAGYGQIVLDGKIVYVHRYVLSLVDDTFSIDDSRQACHHCDNPSCIRPTHLFAGTRSENGQDMVNKGRSKNGGHRGENHGMSFLTEDDVIKIRKRFALGNITMSQLGADYDVSYTTIQKIVRGHIWKHLL